MADSDFFYILVEYLQRQFKYLKDNLKKCLDRRANIMTKSGAAATSLPTCNYFNQMLYLVEGALKTAASVDFVLVSLLLLWTDWAPCSGNSTADR